MQNKSVVDHSYGAVPVSKMPRSVFGHKPGYTTSIDCDYLYPIYTDFGILPGDTVSIKFSLLTRMMSPLLKPIMDNIYGTVYTFFVPDRIIWANAKKHFGEQDNPSDTIAYNIPYINTPNGAAGGVTIGHLFDYFGIPTEAAGIGGAGAPSYSLCNLPGRAYNKIWNDHFRDENLQPSLKIDVGDGPDTWSDYGLVKIGKKFDYFTSQTPNPQKGSTAVNLPLGSTAPVISNNVGISMKGGTPLVDQYIYSSAAGTNQLLAQNNWVGNPAAIVWGSNTGLAADLTNATAPTINSLRQAITLQQFLEIDARSGTRYQEIVRSQFAGVVVPDFRLQRSEIIHIYNFNVKVNPTAQTSASGINGGSTYLADLSAFGTGVSVGEHFVHSFNEHGTLMSLLVIRGENKYSQGISKFWFKRTRYDRYWPVLAGLGEQATLNQEIYANLAAGTGANQREGVFGYLPRYEEYRDPVRSMLTGLMRPGVTGSLAIWNLSELFSAQPTLGATFIQQNTPLDRAVAVPSAPHFLVDCVFETKYARIMPVFGIPGLRRL